MVEFHGYSSLEELERQLSPSQWSKRLNSEAVAMEHERQCRVG